MQIPRFRDTSCKICDSNFSGFVNMHFPWDPEAQLLVTSTLATVDISCLGEC
jgi:hypothetical protein